MKSNTTKIFDKKVIIACLVAALLSFVFFKFILGIAFISGESMTPSYQDHQMVLFNRHAKCQLGDVVVLDTEGILDEAYIIKRVIGLPGDTISIVDGVTYRNGVELDEPYIIPNEYAEQAEMVVPEGTIYVLGDNRPYSLDSSNDRLGPVSETRIVGVVFGSQP